MNKSRNRLLAVIVSIVAALGAIAWYLSRHDVPAGQRPLTNLTAQSLDALRAEFNATSNETRVIVLLSPT